MRANQAIKCGNQVESVQGFSVVPGRSMDFAPVDLLNDFGLLTDRLRIEIDHEHWLDAFLLAAGASQVIDDYMRSAGATLRMGARFLASGGPAARGVAEACRSAAVALDRARVNVPWARRVINHRLCLAELIAALAPLAMGTDTGATSWLCGRSTG